LEASGEGLVLQNFCHALANNDAGRMDVAGGNLLQRALPRGSSAGADFLIGDGVTIAKFPFLSKLSDFSFIHVTPGSLVLGATRADADGN